MPTSYSSFISEHTAEYILVPRLTRILKEEFEIVVPVFPWLTRECNNFSKHIHQNERFGILGFFPRRPKISDQGPIVLIKISDELKMGAKTAEMNNIPMIAGCPIARSFWELNEQTTCIWIKLNANTRAFYEINYNSELNLNQSFSDDAEITIQKDRLVEWVIKNIGEHDFETFSRIVREVKEINSHKYFLAAGVYKPIYFLLK